MLQPNARLLRRVALFKNYSEDELKCISQELTHKKYCPGDLILCEGEFGDRLHVIASGSVQVFTHDFNGSVIVLARLERGSYFGEQALVTSTPLQRNVSIRALTEVEVLSLSHDQFQKHIKKPKVLLKETNQKNLIKNKDFLQDLFKKIRSYSEREIFFQQGDVSQNAYFLLSGCVEIRTYDETNRLKSHQFVRPGLFFGELDTLEKKPRVATAIAFADSQVAIIDPQTLEHLYQENPQFQEFTKAQKFLYQVPALGFAIQFHGEFLGKSAIYTTIHKSNGELITASRIINEDVFSISYADSQDTTHESFQDTENLRRTLLLNDGKLVGVSSIGPWTDLLQISKLVYEKASISPKDLETFHRIGRLELIPRSSFKEGMLCECMQIKVDTIKSLTLQGMDIEKISKKTGAATVCGGCKPRLIELLGGQAWIPVKISKIRKHNESVWSFQLTPFQGKIFLSYQAGQHIVIEGNIQGYWVTRCYTLTLADREKNCYEITVKREGFFSKWLFDQADELIHLRVSEPQGTFTLEPSQAAICLMAGIGITPAIAFAKKATQSHQAKPLYIDYSVRKAEDVLFREDFAHWPKLNPNIFTHIRFTSQKGHIKELDIQSLLIKYPEADFYLCGPKRYENTIREILKKLNLSSGKIHIEEFINAGEPLQ